MDIAQTCIFTAGVPKQAIQQLQKSRPCVAQAEIDNSNTLEMNAADIVLWACSRDEA